MTLPDPGDPEEVRPVYHVKYEDSDREIMTEDQATTMMQAFDASGFKATTGWKSPKVGIRQLQRLDKALAKRRRQASKK